MRICSGAGCLRAIADDLKFCDDCKPVAKTDDGIRSHTNSYDPELDRLRKSPRWQRLAHSVIRAQPMCAICDVHISEIVDHKVPARVAMAQFQVAGLGKSEGYFVRCNLQGLCRPCHYTKTNEDKTHVGEWPDVVEIQRLAPKKTWTF